MRKPVPFVTSAAATVLMICAAMLSPMGTGTAAGAPPGTTGTTTRAPFTPAHRSCDFHNLGSTNFGAVGSGTGEALIHTSGNTVVAEVNFSNPRFLGVHYQVGLIQAPRPAAPGCGPGTPGTAYVDMVIDGAGRAAVTLQDQIRPGMTGVWLKIDRFGPHSQLPAEYYSTIMITPV
ncbi:MAG: hypothetical protein ABI307_05040 [Mycobacterium sp.]